MNALFSLLLFFICLSGAIILVFGVALLLWLRRVARSVTQDATAKPPADDAIEADYVLLDQDAVEIEFTEQVERTASRK